jgi:DNA-binding XRE family transcriptional regulator
MYEIVDMAHDRAGARDGGGMHEVFDAAGLGHAILSLRRSKGWTQAELAGWLDVSRQTVITLEKGGTVALPVAVRAIALLGAKIVIVPKGSSIDERKP